MHLLTLKHCPNLKSDWKSYYTRVEFFNFIFSYVFRKGCILYRCWKIYTAVKIQFGSPVIYFQLDCLLIIFSVELQLKDANVADSAHFNLQDG